MMIWRSLSPKTLADVLELVLDRRQRGRSAGAGAATIDGGGPSVARTGPVAEAQDPGIDSSNA